MWHHATFRHIFCNQKFFLWHRFTMAWFNIFYSKNTLNKPFYSVFPLNINKEYSSYLWYVWRTIWEWTFRFRRHIILTSFKNVCWECWYGMNTLSHSKTKRQILDGVVLHKKNIFLESEMSILLEKWTMTFCSYLWNCQFK